MTPLLTPGELVVVSLDLAVVIVDPLHGSMVRANRPYNLLSTTAQY